MLKWCKNIVTSIRNSMVEVTDLLGKAKTEYEKERAGFIFGSEASIIVREVFSTKSSEVANKSKEMII